MKMKTYKIEELEPRPLSFEGVKEIVDTSGFEPLEVKIKKMLLAGQVASIRANLYDSYEIREMYENVPDVVDDQYDDLEEVNEKIAQINAIRAQIYARKFGADAPKEGADVPEKSSEGKNIVPREKSSKNDDLEE